MATKRISRRQLRKLQAEQFDRYAEEAEAEASASRAAGVEAPAKKPRTAKAPRKRK